MPRTQLALSLLKLPKQQGPGLADCIPCRLQLPLGHRGRDGGEVHCRLKAWARPVDSLGKGSGALQDTAPSLFPGLPSSPASPRPEGLESPGEKARICLLPHSLPDNHDWPELWPDGTSNHWASSLALTVSR